MDKSTRSTAIAAGLILAVFALVAYMLPTIMLWLGDISPYAAGAFVILFLVAPFIVLWLRGRSQRGREE
jgi:membrane protein implicated in regulation of membrane protease activity